MALCNVLCFWTGGDPVRIDELFRQSGLYRPKWDEKHGEQTYGELCVQKAIADTPNRYDPAYNKTTAKSDFGDSPFTRFARAYELVGGYIASKGMLLAESTDKNGEITTKPLANFTPLISKEISRDDGIESKKEFEIDGVTSNGKILPPVAVPANRFAALNWVIDSWGADANIFPGQTVKDKIRYAIQATSAPLMERSTIFTHSGWRRIDGRWAYLHHGGAVGLKGVSIELGGSLAMYQLPEATGDIREAIGASMELLTVLPLRIAAPLLAFTYLAPLHEPLQTAGYAPSTVLYLAGSSGSRKTTAAALALNHFGPAFNEKRIPASFRDTANAVQQKAFELKDAVLLVDDYAPSINPIEQRRMAGEAQKMIRAWGEHSERGRMNADGTLRFSRPPRGLGMMTGEDLPDIGQSGIARLFVVDVKPGDIPANEALTTLQKKAHDGLLARAMRGYIEWLLPQMDGLPVALADLFLQCRERKQDQLSGAHGRQPESFAWLLVGFQLMLHCWKDMGMLDDPAPLWAQAEEALLYHSATQRKTLRDEEPVGLFLSAFKELLITNQVRIYNLNDHDDVFYSAENCAGYQDEKYVYLIPGQAYGAVCSHFREQGTSYPISAAQLWKRMRERGLLEARDNETTRTKHIPGKGSLRLLWLTREATETTGIETTEAAGEGRTATVEKLSWDDKKEYEVVQETLKS
jgi:hypothetical protein